MPTFSICALEGRPVPVYGEGRQRREFLYVTDWVRRRARGAGPRRAPVGSTTSAAGTSWRTSSSLAASARWPARPSRRSRSSPIGPVTTSGTACARSVCGHSGGSPQVSFDDGLALHRRLVPRAPRVAPRRASGPDRDGAPPGRCRRVRLVVTGAGGGLGRAFLAQVPAHHEVHAFSHAELDVGDRDAVMRTIPLLRPDAVLNFAAFTQRRRLRDGSGARHARQRARRAARRARRSGVRRRGPARVDRLRLRRR